MNRYLITLCYCFIITGTVLSQGNIDRSPEKQVANSPLPFKVLTSGKRITIQSTKNISNVIAWNRAGIRITEQKNLDATRCAFTAGSNDRLIFVMIELKDGKRYTQKIGLE
jgi:hypothetical protein